MTTKNMLFSALAFSLSGLLITTSAAAQEGQGTQDQVTNAAATKIQLGVPLTLMVTGLTKDNIEQVKLGLTAMTEKVYVCPGCNHVGAVAGECTPCDLELKATEEPILSAALPSFEGASIRLTPFAARTLRYSDLERSLTRSSVKIDDAKFPLAGDSRLVLNGGSTENARSIETALKASKLFDTVKAEYDAKSSEIRVAVHANTATPPMHDQVTAVIDALGTKLSLSDVVWGPRTIPAKG